MVTLKLRRKLKSSEVPSARKNGELWQVPRLESNEKSTTVVNMQMNKKMERSVMQLSRRACK